MTQFNTESCRINSKCLVEGFFWVTHWVSSSILAIVGVVFDAVIEFSLNSQNIGASFVGDSWGTIRDIANITFIFILLYMSIATILQIGGHGYKELLVKLILVALLVNFSLFITKVVIDSSNIFALQFYNSISTANGSISQGLADGFSPQSLFGGTGEVKSIQYIIIYFVSSVINIIGIYAFTIASVLFVARIVALYFIMIVAPLAFVAWILPATKSYFSQWCEFRGHNT